MFIIANTVSTWSLHYISTGLGALIGALYPLIVVLLERFFFEKKRIAPLTIFGLILGVLGVGIVFYDNLLDGDSRNLLLGMGMAFIATFSWSIGTIVVTKNETGLNPYYSIGWQMLISSVIVILVSRFVHPFVPIADISLAGWLSLFYLIIIGSIIAFAAFIYSMQVLPHAIASLFAYFNPLVAIILGSLMLQEKISVDIVTGSVVTLLGVFIVNYSARKRKVVIAEPEI
jgi:drug/metabolite transporter (DMT)-like permease